MRRLAILSAALVLSTAACLLTKSDTTPTVPAQEQEGSSEGEGLLPEGTLEPAVEATSYPTLSPQQENSPSFIEENAHVPEGALQGMVENFIQSADAPTEALQNLALSGKVFFTGETFDGDGTMLVAIYEDEATALQVFNAWDDFIYSPFMVGYPQPEPLPGGGQYVAKLEIPLPNAAPGTPAYTATSYFFVQRCRLVVSLKLRDFSAGAIPTPEGEGHLPPAEYLRARRDLNDSITDSGLSTMRAMESVACADDLDSVLAAVQPAASGAGASTGEGVPVEILTHFVVGSGEDRKIVGELINNGPRPIQFVSILVNFHDAGGNLVGVEEAYVPRVFIRPGERSPFTVDDYSIPEGWTDYELELVDYEESVENYGWSDDFEIAGDELITDDNFVGPFVQTSGTVGNTGSESVYTIQVLVSLYDRDDDFIGTGSTLLLDKPSDFESVTILEPGDSAPFTVTVYLDQLVGEVDHYVLYAQGALVDTGS